jgi:hypothetical protein
VRNVRRDANEQLKKLAKDKQCSEDDERRARRPAKLTDRVIGEIDQLLQVRKPICWPSSDAMFTSSCTIPQSRSIPRHVAIIMDGNGRWANKRLPPRVAGHRKASSGARDGARRSSSASST